MDRLVHGLKLLRDTALIKDPQTHERHNSRSCEVIAGDKTYSCPQTIIPITKQINNLEITVAGKCILVIGKSLNNYYYRPVQLTAAISSRFR